MSVTQGEQSGGHERPGHSTRRSSVGSHPPLGKLLYPVLWTLCRTLAITLFGFRVRFARQMPRDGGLILLSTHQSHLDPILVGLASPRRLSSLARSTLFRHPAFAALLTALDAIPIDREASTVGAMKAVIGRLREGGTVVIFPEGTRTATGRIGTIKGGFAIVARRAGVPLMPVAVVGAYECWPRSRVLPRLGRVRVEFGELIMPQEVAALDDKALLVRCDAALRALDASARLAWKHAEPPVSGLLRTDQADEPA